MRSPDPRFPSLPQAIGLVLLLLLLEVLLQGIAMLALGARLPSPAVQAGVVVAASAVVLWVALRRRGEGPRQAFPLRPVGAPLLGAITLTILGGTVVMSEADNLLRSLLPPPRWLEELFEQLLLGGQGLWASLLLVAIVAPLTEELLFRGVVLRGFVTRYPARRAIVLAALLFGASHLNPWQFGSATVFGLLAGWWLVRTGSLVPCLFGHALNNAVPAVAVHLFRVEIPGYTGALTEAVQFQPLWFDLLGLVLVSAGLGWTAGLLEKTDGEGRGGTERDRAGYS
ncbi:MAG: lysostaphin resistance A-like protein, partial [Gemmatimonadales bacterium]